jgi:hypothetical protein
MKIQKSYINFTSVSVSDEDLVNCKAIYIGSVPAEGDKDISLSQSDTLQHIIFKNVAAGSILPIELKNGRIMDTDTTASDIVLLDW